MKSTLLRAGLLCVITGVLAFTWVDAPSHDELTSERAEILMRNIGHRLLWSIGDSSSIVLPVTKVAEQTYQINMAKDFGFSHDSLISIVDESLSTAGELDYRVRVLNCKNQQLIYGFEVMRQGSVTPCEGRIQPRGCYAIQIALLPVTNTTTWATYAFTFFGIALLIGGWARSRPPKDQQISAPYREVDLVRIGDYEFDAARRLLKWKDVTAELSFREAQLLGILALHQNELVARDVLMKVWEDEGIFVGRSLDVFMSRLRKRLQHDKRIRIIGVHGKGYQLEIT